MSLRNMSGRSSMVLVLAAALCLAQAYSATAAEVPRVLVSASASSVQVAEPFSLELKVTAPTGTKVTLPATGSQLGDFDVLETQDLFDIPDADSNEVRQWIRRMTLESIVTGELHIPEIEVRVTGKDGSQTLKSNSVDVRVVSVLEDRSDPTHFRDIQSVIDVPLATPTSASWLWWTLAGGGGLVVLATVGVFVARRQRWITPQGWALEQLDHLQRSVTSESASSEQVALELSQILRDYLHLQFAIAEAGRTLPELLQDIESRRVLDEEMIERINELFSTVDKVKFAGWQLSQLALKQALSDSRDLIHRIADALEAVDDRARV